MGRGPVRLDPGAEAALLDVRQDGAALATAREIEDRARERLEAATASYDTARTVVLAAEGVLTASCARAAAVKVPLSQICKAADVSRRTLNRLLGDRRTAAAEEPAEETAGQ